MPQHLQNKGQSRLQKNQSLLGILIIGKIPGHIQDSQNDACLVILPVGLLESCLCFCLPIRRLLFDIIPKSSQANRTFSPRPGNNSLFTVFFSAPLVVCFFVNRFLFCGLWRFMICFPYLFLSELMFPIMPRSRH